MADKTRGCKSPQAPLDAVVNGDPAVPHDEMPAIGGRPVPRPRGEAHTPVPRPAVRTAWLQRGRLDGGWAGKGALMETRDVLGTRYRLDQRIAVGGMGDVWAARDELLGRRVALKLLHPNLAADEGFRRRFRAEAKAVARLSHPGIVSVFDYGEDADVAYLAMELVDGEPLSSVLRRRGRLDATETLGLVAQASEALAAAHAAGLVHRDVKPANLLLRPDGRLKVTDFGIVRAGDTATMTNDGSVLGTVAYMSPEQVRGERVASASDIYSLGVVAYECLVGDRPYTGAESIAVALAHLHDPVPELPQDVPAGVRRLVTAMLQKDPDARPPSAQAVAERARRLAAGAKGAWTGSVLLAPAASAPSDGPPTEPFGIEAPPGGPPGTLALAGLAEPPTMALAPPRPVVMRSRGPSRQWVPITAAAVGALLIALLLASTLGGGTAPSVPSRLVVTVPSLHGVTLRTAERRLAELGLRVSTGPADPSPADLVLSERPGAGSHVRRGSTVRLTVTAPAPVSPTTTTTTTLAPVTTTTAASPPAPRHGPPGRGPGGKGPPGH